MCNENLDLVKLLGNCPKGTKLWSPLFGELNLEFVEKRSVGASIVTSDYCGSPCRFSEDGTYYQGYKDAECVLFPSKECRDWSKFELFKDGDIVVSYDVRPFILKGSTDGKFPLAYGGVNSRCEFIPSVSIGERAWCSGILRKATPQEVDDMMTKMKEAGYMWDADQKVLKKDLPVDTLVVACDSYSSTFYFHSMVVRRYAGNHRCFNNNGGSSRSCNTLTEWRHIIPLDKLIVNKEGVVELDKVTDYGTCNYNA